VTKRIAGASDLVQLTKPRLTTLVVVTALVGFVEGRRGPVDWPLLLQTMLGTFLVAGAASALNQWFERDADGRMRRTETRPIPGRRLTPAQGAVFGIVLLIAGAAWLALAANRLASGLAVLTAACYLVAYTPLKPVTSLATIVGAVPGAIPPMIGWAAARGELGAGAWVLFAIVFFWQMPHFLAIATLYRQDYASGGFRVLPVVDPQGGSTGRQAVLYALALMPVVLLAVAAGLAGPWFAAGALLLTTGYAAGAVALLRAPGDVMRARKLFRLSLIYLPLLLIMLVAL
jgi:protoheme IX farnesyltransferase